MRRRTAGILAVACVLAAPPAAARAAGAEECKRPGYRAVYLEGRALALQGRGQRLAVCDLKTGRAVGLEGRIKNTRFTASGEWIGLSYESGGRDRVASINPSSSVANVHTELGAGSAVVGHEGRLVFEVDGRGIFLMDPAGEVQRVARPSEWAGGLTVSDRLIANPFGFWEGPDGAPVSGRMRIGRRINSPNGELTRLGPIFERDGDCAIKGYRLAAADGVARVLRSVRGGRVQLCHSRTGVRVPVRGDDELTLWDFSAAGGYTLLATEDEGDSGPVFTVHLTKDGSELRRIPGRPNTVEITRDGTAVFDIGKELRTLTFEGEEGLLTEDASLNWTVDPSGIAFWRENGRTESAEVR